MNMSRAAEHGGRRLTLAGHIVARDAAPFVIAEIGVNHQGRQDVARAMILAAARSGADAVKFQLFDADLLLANEAGLVDYQKTAANAQSARDLLAPLQLSPEQLRPLVTLAHAYGMAAVVTPFSPALVAATVDLGVDAIKLASPDLVNLPLAQAAAETGKPLILSTGAATWAEIDQTLQWLAAARDRIILLQCVSSYPTPPDAANLQIIAAMRSRYPDLPIGYSDHTRETITGALAVATGACLLEKHFTLDANADGPDHRSSLPPAEFRAYAGLAGQAFAMRGGAEKQVLPMEEPVRR